MIVEVNLGQLTGDGEERIEPIVVFDGDTTQQLAIDFCNKHSLNNSLKNQLQQLIQNQID